MTKREILTQLLIDTGQIASLAALAHVGAAHQEHEDVCNWPSCKGARETRDGIHRLIDRINDETLDE